MQVVRRRLVSQEHVVYGPSQDAGHEGVRSEAGLPTAAPPRGASPFYFTYRAEFAPRAHAELAYAGCTLLSQT